MNRDQRIVRTSIIGIVANLLLAGFKAGVGMLSGSIAIVLDAVNNLSDALSSVITIVGTKLALKKPDRKHPLGYGRIEYLSALMIAMIILYAGFTSMEESIKKIMHPTTPEYTKVGIVIIAVAVLVKVLLGTYVKKVGKDVRSDSLIASGEDALLDSVISFSTVVAAVIFVLWKVSIEAWLGAAISLIIIKAGVEMVRDTLSQILGERVDGDITKQVKATINSFEEVRGAYDLILHSYGPDRLIGSVHIEIPDTCSIDELDHLERAIAKKVREEHQVTLAGIGIYSINSKNPQVQKDRENIEKIVLAYEHVLQIHGFRIEYEERTISFDAVIGFGEKNLWELQQKLVQSVQEQYPEYEVTISLDADISD